MPREPWRNADYFAIIPARKASEATMRIAIIAAGEMGAAIGRRLVERGAEVTTSLAGRSPASRQRAERAGMIAVDEDTDLIARADLFLSILPPAEALSLVRRLAPALKSRPQGLLYVDCNAIAPVTVRQVGEIAVDAGARFADVGIIGGPPRADGYSPHLYASGEGAAALSTLRDFGLDIRPVDGGIGAASALKLSYAALTKGLSAIAVAVARGAEDGHCAAALRAEFAESQPQLLAWLRRQIPGIYPKAYRWVGEMEEIARFLTTDPTAEMFRGAARTYDGIAEHWQARDEARLGFLADLFGR
jgi:3-hydroxyisobutyrate dehydrogenase-like beta-hydroxyacid dehydrogenase